MAAKNRMVLILMAGIFLAAISGIPAWAADKNTEKKEAPVVTEGSTVKVHYKLTVEGDVVDSSEGRDPLEFTVGNGQVIPGFENGVKGMTVGDKKSFEVAPTEGYGEEDPKGYQEIPKDKLPPDVEPKAGMTLYARGDDGQPFPVQIKEVKDDVVVLNFNHPLAGKTLNFDVEMMEIN